MLILISWPFNQHAYTRLGIDVLEDKGIDFKILNLFELLYPENKEVSFNRIKHEKEITVQSYKELKIYLSKGEYILNFLNVKRKTIKVFLLFTIFKIDYISISNMPIPSDKNIKLKILNFVLRSSKYGAVVKKRNEFPYSNKTKYIYIHSIDYDTMIRFERKKEQRIIEENYIVFLDQNLPFHLDFIRNSEQSYVTPTAYYKSLNTYFDNLEKKLNVKIVIAAHPNSDNSHFSQRTIVKNDTINLVKYSDSVLIHSSTALSFAVIYNKPICMIITDEIEKSKMQIFNKKLSQQLDIPLINIDKEMVFKFEQKKKFMEYKREFISQAKDSTLLSMEIILKRLINDNKKY